MASNKSHVLLVRVPREGAPFESITNVSNIIEITAKDDSTCWMKYWDGKEIRSCIVKGTLCGIYRQFN